MTSETGLHKGSTLPCGGETYFDHESGISYRCMNCFAVVGSIGMPRECAQLMKAERAAKILGYDGQDTES